MSTVPAQVFREGSTSSLLRPSNGSLASFGAAHAPIRVIPPSGASTPSLPVHYPAALAACQAYAAREVSYPSYTMGAHTPAVGSTMAWGEPLTMEAMHGSHGSYTAPVSISIPAPSSYVPPPRHGQYVRSASSSYAPPAHQESHLGFSYSAPPAPVLNGVHRISTPGMPPSGYVLGAAPRVSVALAPRAPAVAHINPDELARPSEPQVPPSLTAGIPDPPSIERQKQSYAKGLDEQLKHGTEVLAQQLKQQSDYLFSMGDQRKRQYALQVDQEIKQKEMELAQQHNEQLLVLQQAAQQQKSALEHQANALLLEYQQKKSAEDLAYQSYQFQKRQYETQLQYNDEMRDLQGQQQAAAHQVAQQKNVLAQQAVAAQHQAAASARTVQETLKMVSSTAPGSTSLRAASSSYAAPPMSYSMTTPGSYTPTTVYSAAPASYSLQAAPGGGGVLPGTSYGGSVSVDPNSYWAAGTVA